MDEEVNGMDFDETNITDSVAGSSGPASQCPVAGSSTKAQSNAVATVSEAGAHPTLPVHNSACALDNKAVTPGPSTPKIASQHRETPQSRYRGLVSMTPCEHKGPLPAYTHPTGYKRRLLAAKSEGNETRDKKRRMGQAAPIGVVFSSSEVGSSVPGT